MLFSEYFIFMILIFLFNQIYACEFSLKLDQDKMQLIYDLQEDMFTAFGIWTRYYAFYQNISIDKGTTYYGWDQYYEYTILKGFDGDGEQTLGYSFVKEKDSKDPNHYLYLFDPQNYNFEEYFTYDFIDEFYEGAWTFTYIGFDYFQNRIDIIIVNTKTNKFVQQWFIGALSYQINHVEIKEDFPGQVSFSQSQSTQVKFTDGEEILLYLQTCIPEYQCYSNQINNLISGIMNTYEQPFQFTMQDNYWIDGWFKFTPLISMRTYNNLILQIVQYDKEVFKYNGIIPLKIILNYDTNNLDNNGITVETSSYSKPIWDDSNLNPIKVSILNKSYLQLIQHWVYFRFLQFDQSDHNAEFYLSFSDSDYVIKNFGQLNLFKYGKFFIYVGQSQLNPNAFAGYIANINIQSCLTNYPLGKRGIQIFNFNFQTKGCHITCLTCNGPSNQNCLTCIDESETNRILNPLTSSCNCKEGFISQEGQIKCVGLQQLLKSSSFQQLQTDQIEQPCKDGQFQYNIGSLIKCYDCPQQSSFGIICADCLENLYTWQYNMKCSYDYYQENRNQNNNFIKFQRPQQRIDYYYIQDELLICQGCQLQEGGNKIVQDKTILYGKCIQSYYYKDQQCQPCQQQNCLQCNDLTGECSQCEIGFVLQDQICYSCPDYCLTCTFGDKILCTLCPEGFTLGNGVCFQCSTNCLTCQYDTNLKRPKCLVCKYDGYYLPFDGIDCVQNNIQNCQIQYQLQLTRYSSSVTPECSFIYITTTLGFSKGCKKNSKDPKQIFDICGLCNPYYMNFQTNCTYNGTLNSDEQALIKYYCHSEFCIGSTILLTELIYITSLENPQQVITNCQIDQCIQCMQVQNILKCYQCLQGYYANILNGLCVQCPPQLNCYTCLQQNRNEKDGWKWKIRPYFIYEYQSDLVSSSNSKDYEIICLACLDGYMLLDNICILNCPKNCQKCSIIDGQNVCTFCGSNTYDKLLTIQDNQCSNCPNNCEFCQPRKLSEIQKINGLFNPDDGSKYFYSYICLKPRTGSGIYYNQFLQQYVKCQDCMSQLHLKLKVHCDLQSYDNESNKYDNMIDFYNENIIISDVFTNSAFHFQNIETLQFLEYLNVNQIMSLIYELILVSSSDSCVISNFVSTAVPRNVFSMLKNKLIINANNLTLISQGAQILNFSEVEIIQSKFSQGFSIRISHPNHLIVSFKDINHVSTQTNSIQIIIINPSSIQIQNFYIQAISNLVSSQSNIISYDFTNTSTVTDFSIKIDNLLLTKSQFYDIDFFSLFADYRIQKLVMDVSDSVIECKFHNASFIKESQVTNNGQIQLNNVSFMVHADNSSLIDLNGQLTLQSSVKLTGNLSNSNFIRTNYFYITDSHIYNTTLQNTTLFDNKISNQDNKEIKHQMNNLKFENILFDNSNFISIVDKNMLGQIIIDNITIYNCQFSSKQLIKTTQRLIIIEGLTFQLLNSYFYKNVLGLTDIAIKQSYVVIIDNVTVQGNNIQGLQKKLDCYQELVNISLQNSFILMQNVQTIQVLNSQFNNIMIQNYPIIGIYLFEDSIEYVIEVINTSFKNNLILKTEILSQNSIFQLLSTKAGNFKIIDVSFIENILNEYSQTQFSNSATTFLIEADQFNITLNNLVLIKNQIFNSSDSNLYLEANRIIMENSTFTKSNKYDDFILSFVIWGVMANNFYQEDLQQIFPILSVGANAKIVVDIIEIQFCQFSDSVAYQGSGFHLTLQNSLKIFQTTFQNLRNKLDKDDSQGGSIFINLIAQNATIVITDSNFSNSSSLYDGGAIYLNSRYTTSNIILQQISVQNCYSFKGTFISFYLNQHSSLRITNISVKNNIEGFNDYLSQFNVLNENQVEQFQLNSAIFYIQYGSLYLKNSIISDIQLSSVLYYYSGTYLYINELIIQNKQFSSKGLIQIIPTSNTITITFIQNVEIINCSNVQPQQITCYYEQISFNNSFQCNNYDNKPKFLTLRPQDSKAKVNCLYNKLLDFTPSSNMIYVDMIQTSDYLYISDLNMRNNNCLFCKDGMIAIRNIDINNPEYNNIIIKQIQFQNNQCGFGCLVISQQQIINLPSRRILQNTLYQSRFTIPFTVLIEKSEFFNNSAQNGMIIVSNLSLSMIDNKLIKNTGSDLSGGILFLGGENHTFQIMTSEISDNIGNKGGAFYLGNKTISSTELLQVLLSSNQANSYGKDFVGSPQALTISLDGGKTLFQTKQISQTPTIIQEITIQPYKILGNSTQQQFITLPSGQNINKYQYYNETSKSFKPYNLSLRLIALNSLKQQIFNLPNTYCMIKKRKINIKINDSTQFDDQGLSISKVYFNNTSQDYNLDELIINFDPYLSDDYVMQIQFKCSSVQIPIINNSPPYNIIDYSNNYELRMNVRTFKCQRGESYNNLLGTCNLCDSSQSYYSVTIKASKCSVQDEITMKNVNSTHIELRENYWRPYNDNNIVTYCYNFHVNCNGGWSPGDDSCTLGHIGALCEQCDLYDIRGQGQFSATGQFQCGSCSNLSLNSLQIFLIIMWTLISIFLSVKGTVENVDEFIIRVKAIKVGFASVHYERVQIAVLVKILTNYLQIISSIGTFQLKLPSALKSLFTYSGNPIKSAMYSLDCFLIELSNIQILYFRNIWFVFMPIYYSTIIFIIYFLLVKLKYMEFKITVLSTTLIFIFIYVQPDIIGSFISLVSYRKISDVFWVQGNVSYLYLTTEHAKWLLTFVVPILLLFGFIIPLILYIQMSKYKDKLNDTLVMRLYGYLYNEYSNATYYWEIIKICQKELIIIFLTFYEDIIIIKGTIVFIIIFCYDIFSKSFKPYKRVDLNKLDSQSSFVCGFSIVLGMAIYFADQNGNQEILWPFFFILGIFNLYFIIILIKLLIIGYLDKLADQIDQVRDIINNKYPNLISNYPWLKKYLENSKVKSARIKQRYQQLKGYLLEKAHLSLQQKKNQKLQTEDIDIKQNELLCNHESRNDDQMPKKSKTQSLQDENIQDNIIIELDKEKINKIKIEKAAEDKMMEQNNNLYKCISQEDQNIQEFNQEDLWNNNNDEEQVNISQQ